MGAILAGNVIPFRSENSATMDDADIKFVAEDSRKRAFELVVRKYREKLFQHALYMLKDSQEAFDVTQETLIRAYQEPNLFTPDFKIKSWLFRVITNLCYNITRDRRRRGGILKMMVKPLKKESTQALDEMLQREAETHVVKALAKVPEKYRTILLLKYYHEMSYIEISEVLNCKLGTVMSRLSRAREKLQLAMELE